MEDKTNITIIGLGLIGGSLASALKKNVTGIKIYGIDFPLVIKKAEQMKIIDKGLVPEQMENAVPESDIIFIATPISRIEHYLKLATPLCRPGSIVTDTGSTKVMITEKAREISSGNFCFIGGHPMTGKERNGIEHIDPLIFENSVYVLTPESETEKEKVRKLALLLEKTGARVLFLRPGLHDKIAAFVSHVPQLLAVALTNLVGEHNRSSDNFLRLAAGGFRDMTRIASSPYEMWEQIIDSNKDQIALAIDEMIDSLGKIKEAVFSGSLEKQFESAAKFRLSIPQDTRGFFLPHFDIIVDVEDKPGVLAEISAALAKEEINIKDIQVLKVREGEAGVFRIALQSQEERMKSVNILNSIGYRAEPGNQ